MQLNRWLKYNKDYPQRIRKNKIGTALCDKKPDDKKNSQPLLEDLTGTFSGSFEQGYRKKIVSCPSKRQVAE